MAAKHLPISVSQFREHFHRSWSKFRRTGIQPRKHGIKNGDDSFDLPRRLGLAVSGGADSMALAYLCRQLEQSAVAGVISVTAFVVDHRARAESSHEAKKVAGWLSDLGIKTQVLELDWPQVSGSQDQSSSKNAGVSMPSAFETHARRLRFQALGLACRENGIETLLMGHHQDDDVETTIWRLSSGARGAGLAGIPRVARIPECHGLFGVSESGSSWKIPAANISPQVPVQVRFNGQNEGRISISSDPESKTPTTQKQAPPSSLATEISLATGGILLCRPLLSFPKANMLATCHENCIPYVSDPTNFDPTLTPRNAIRSLLASNAFPRALQPTSILSLIRASQDLLQTSDELSNQLLKSQCRILDANHKTGTVILQILDSASTAPPDPQLANLPAFRLHQIQTLTLRRITELVSPFPRNHFSLRSFEPFVPRLFVSSNNSHDDPLSRKKQSFTLGGVMFQPLAREHSMPESTSKHAQGAANIWLLSRQPFMKNRSPVTKVDTPMAGPWTSWTLWDHRYWFRFSVTPSLRSQQEQLWHERQAQSSSITLRLRPFQQPDLQKIRAGFEVPGRKGRKKHPAAFLMELRKRLSVEAPGPVRFSVPVLAVERSPATGAQESDTREEAEQFLALPTMRICLTGDSVDNTRADEVEIYSAGRWWMIKWECMYKMIDTQALGLMGWSIEEAEEAMVHDNKG
ncbi:hypothetical protein NUU61_003984 [Penicillium alfredii]|uniref:tRNA(Ile)-lysidine synthetase n=1 Tax=Penicillium alfredii TaxID=1506179 RepID=A0A9W9KE73_9EURO|nr:uncharacterized protein NUU61_003984 [Penicillium alfredii]KAJ5101762.1 hypothetical protein NUU61_003984 [Penicillium alfredii]